MAFFPSFLKSLVFSIQLAISLVDKTSHDVMVHEVSKWNRNKICVKMKEQFLPQLEYLRRSSDYSGKHFRVIGALRGSLSTDNCQTHSPTGDRSTILCLLLITKFSSNKITGKDVGILSVNGTGILGEISGVSQTSRTYDPPMTCSGAITLSYRRLEGA